MNCDQQQQARIFGNKNKIKLHNKGPQKPSSSSYKGSDTEARGAELDFPQLEVKFLHVDVHAVQLRVKKLISRIMFGNHTNSAMAIIARAPTCGESKSCRKRVRRHWGRIIRSSTNRSPLSV